MTTENKEQEVTTGEIQTGETHLATFDQIDKAIVDLKERFAGRVYSVEDDPDGMKVAKADRKEAKTIRTGIDKDRKRFKAFYLEGGRAVDAAAKRLTTAVSEIEDPIDEIIKAEEKRISDAKEKHLKEVQEFVETCRFELNEHCSVELLGDRLKELWKIDPDKKFLKEATELTGKILADSIAECDAALKIAQAREEAEAQRLAGQKAEDDRLADEKARLDQEKEDFRLEKEAEAAEAGRVDAIKALINAISIVPAACQGADSDNVLLALQELEAMEIDDVYQEFHDQAQETLSKAIRYVKEIYEKTKAAEEEADRLEAQRVEQENREKRQALLNEIMEMAGPFDSDVTADQVSGVIELIKEKTKDFEFGDMQKIAESAISSTIAKMEELRLELVEIEAKAAAQQEPSEERTSMRADFNGAANEQTTVTVSEMLQNMMEHSSANGHPDITISYKAMERLIGLALEQEKRLGEEES